MNGSHHTLDLLSALDEDGDEGELAAAPESVAGGWITLEGETNIEQPETSFDFSAPVEAQAPATGFAALSSADLCLDNEADGREFGLGHDFDPAQRPPLADEQPGEAGAPRALSLPSSVAAPDGDAPPSLDPSFILGEAPPEAGATESTRDLLLDALEVAGEAPTPARKTRSKPYSFLPEAELTERRNAMRFPIAVDTEIVFDLKRRHKAFTTSGSVNALFVRTRHPVPAESNVWVELRMLGSRSRRLPGVVVRATDSGFAIQLDPDPRTLAYRSTYIDLARQPSLQHPTLRIELIPEREVPSEFVDELATGDDLANAWAQVLETPQDEEVNQEFIHTCMRAQNLEYALDRYRERVANGDGEAERYLEQIGTILGFYNMPQNDTPLEADGFVRGRTKGWIGLILALLAAIAAAQILMRDASEPEVKAPRHDGPGLIHTRLEKPF